MVVKNEVPLNYNFHGLINAYHQYVFKYKIINNRKISATVNEIFNKIETGSSKMSNVSSEHP